LARLPCSSLYEARVQVYGVSTHWSADGI